MLNRSKWQVWRNRRGRVKGVAIVLPASDYGLELHTSLAPEHHEEFCKELCAALNASWRVPLGKTAAREESK